SPDDAWEATLSSVGDAVPFTSEHARLADGLVAINRPLGLYLGDRACLALALAPKLPRIYRRQVVEEVESRRAHTRPLILRPPLQPTFGTVLASRVHSSRWIFSSPTTKN